jgi:hypothetical protein
MARAGQHPLPLKRKPEPKAAWWAITFASGRVLVGYRTKRDALDSAPRFEATEGAWTIARERAN